MMTAELHLRTGQGPGDIPMLVAAGEVDMTNVDTFRRALVEAGKIGGCLILDLAGLRYLDSTGVAALFALARNVRLDVVASDMIAPVLEISGFDLVATVRSGSGLRSQ
jgi:anti-anti-sigma factor